jgi:Neuraminidase (sialidase)
MRVSFSKDQGKTWSKPVKTKLKGYPQHLLQLKDGRILATYGYRYQPFGIRASISKDGGKTWDLDNEIVIRSGGINCDLGYPVSIEMEDGKILSVYYYNDKARNDCFIEGAFYKP